MPAAAAAIYDFSYDVDFTAIDAAMLMLSMLISLRDVSPLMMAHVCFS